MTSLGFFYNPDAKHFRFSEHDDPPSHSRLEPRAYHSQLPNFEQTPLVHVPGASLGLELPGLDNVFIKDEGARLGLPSFKILGASWATYLVTQKHPEGVELVTATDGNHGRAIAYMARLSNKKATIFVPNTVNEYTRQLIRGEGAEVKVEFCDYDTAVMRAYHYAEAKPDRLFIQDTSFPGYHEIPEWIIEGYSTMFEEIEEQLANIDLRATHVFAPVGVGSLAHAVVTHCKSKGRSIAVVAVESEVAACLQTSLRNGRKTAILTQPTIMDGINCGSVSDISWDVLKNGVDGAVTVSDCESHATLTKLETIGIKSGPCGASTMAALQKLLADSTACAVLELNCDSVVVLLNTEGPREYEIHE